MLQGCDTVIASSEPYNARVFAACPQLKLVARCGVGTDAVDMAAAAEAGVVVTNTPGAMTEAVADYTFALMLGISRRLPESDALMRSGGWNEFRGVLVYGKTLGLVGVGRIGQAVAQRAKGFAMRILAYDPILQASGKGDLAIEFVPLDELLAQSDYVSAHAPSTPETVQMFNAERFAKMKPTAYFINTARGALVDETALLAALQSGTIAGAGIDVYAKEPCPADNPLRHAPNCVLTPHNAFNALEATIEMSRQSAQSILDLMQGRLPDNICNPAVWESPNLRVPKPV
ncbi:MAG: D-isomer specific 2-hydroxyacid dehydrogenase [Chthonomonadaceae bacterium]|nr:D-isomer specific 2-hydroxyacid dehydrogenase [Chthonomonadaceae bacterium]